MLDPLFLKELMDKFCDENIYTREQFLKDFAEGYNNYPYYKPDYSSKKVLTQGRKIQNRLQNKKKNTKK